MFPENIKRNLCYLSGRMFNRSSRLNLTKIGHSEEIRLSSVCSSSWRRPFLPALSALAPKWWIPVQRSTWSSYFGPSLPKEVLSFTSMVCNKKSDVHFLKIRRRLGRKRRKMAAAVSSREARCPLVGRNLHKLRRSLTPRLRYEVRRYWNFHFFHYFVVFEGERMYKELNSEHWLSRSFFSGVEANNGYLRLARMRGGSAERGRGCSHFVFCYKLTLGELQNVVSY